MSKGLFLALVMAVSAGFISGCQKKAAEEQTMEISAPAEGTVSAPAEAPAQIQITQPQVQSPPAQAPVPAAAPAAAVTPEAAPKTEKAQDIVQEFIPPSPEDIQKALKNAGLYEGTIDGKIGPKTTKAIEDFQAKNNLKADGKVGRRTWEKMKAYLNMPPAVSQEAGN